MIKKRVQVLFTGLGAVLGFYYNDLIGSFYLPLLGVDNLQGIALVNMGLGAIVFFVAITLLGSLGIWLVQKGEENVAQVPLSDLFASMTGLILGLLISVMLFPSLEKLSFNNSIIPVAFTVILAIIGARLGYARREDLMALLMLIRTGKDRKSADSTFEEHKILDTSVIIDGRIADICKTGFIEGTLVIPEFVLEELQHIADSSDLLKRNRGRRGLDILNKIQKELAVKVLIYEGDFEEISEVDSKLVRLAKVLKGKVITNDFNLNKVCELQGVSVLNINDLANAVKPVVLPGEEILVQVIKDGKENGQGVAYLDDGTMIVVEGGREYIGATMEVMVTSVLQTSAGRMIFAKPKLLEKAQ